MTTAIQKELEEEVVVEEDIVEVVINVCMFNHYSTLEQAHMADI